MSERAITHQQVIDLVMSMPPERLVSIYDFTLFVKSHPHTAGGTVDLFGETANELQADEAQWDRQFADSRDKLRSMGRQASEEFRAGRTQPMKFTPKGRLTR